MLKYIRLVVSCRKPVLSTATYKGYIDKEGWSMVNGVMWKAPYLVGEMQHCTRICTHTAGWLNSHNVLEQKLLHCLQIRVVSRVCGLLLFSRHKYGMIYELRKNAQYILSVRFRSKGSVSFVLGVTGRVRTWFL